MRSDTGFIHEEKEAPNSERFEVAELRLHVSGHDDDWSVWLNTEVADFDGVRVGCGTTKAAAISDALTHFESGFRLLRELRNR